MTQLEFKTQFRGQITKVFETRRGTSAKTGNSWSSTDFMLEETGKQHVDKIIFNVYGDDNLNTFNLHQGDFVEVSLGFSVTYYNDKPYNQIRAWNVVHLGDGSNAPAPAPQGGNQVIMQNAGQGGMSAAQQAQTLMPPPPAQQDLENAFNTAPAEEGGLPF